MSELTTCNFCNHRQSLKAAKAEGMVITVLPDFELGGVSEYKHPPNVNVKKLSKEERKQYDNGVWYMELPSHCCC